MSNDSNEREQLLTALSGSEKFLLITHENVDGDALGSVVAMQGILTQVGKDSLILMAVEEFPLPHEYRFLELGQALTGELPADIAERVVVFLDCGNIDRNPIDTAKFGGAMTVNIDHHHDNTCFADINYVVGDASCTAEIIWKLIPDLGATLTTEIAQALYAGLVTDTGRFMYQNTGADAHLMAADLIKAGVDVHGTYRMLYEGIPYGKLALLARGLSKCERYLDDKLTITLLEQEDFKAAAARTNYSEGVVDHLRAVDGTVLAALVRELPGDTTGGPRYKISLRAANDEIDVSVIAREQGGGGHQQAAGFTTELAYPELVEFICSGLKRQL